MFGRVCVCVLLLSFFIPCFARTYCIFQMLCTMYMYKVITYCLFYMIVWVFLLLYAKALNLNVSVCVCLYFCVFFSFSKTWIYFRGLSKMCVCVCVSTLNDYTTFRIMSSQSMHLYENWIRVMKIVSKDTTERNYCWFCISVKRAHSSFIIYSMCSVCLRYIIIT